MIRQNRYKALRGINTFLGSNICFCSIFVKIDTKPYGALTQQKCADFFNLTGLVKIDTKPYGALTQQVFVSMFS